MTHWVYSLMNNKLVARLKLIVKMKGCKLGCTSCKHYVFQKKCKYDTCGNECHDFDEEGERDELDEVLWCPEGDNVVRREEYPNIVSEGYYCVCKFFSFKG